ncbi:TlpA disulfide reductase family protein [Pelomonas sp. SE-A7]|uniref:TlpA family protein disulfide reductase n=1 Tax=Pelomonas sp. SE-A7 TaxID=3054953 RepID=UPI00259CC26F|nr:TlpA disulfide reductase family protein [Pelomonas sp. SE-A7]MDM4765872.1 TlpA disulfide reductase family protein [Pelomonas sp. SE-A7]
MRRRDLLLASPGLLGAAGAQAQAVERPWPKGQATPPLQLKTHPEGQPWSLAAQRGKAVLLNFWASWCEPCRAELPSLELLDTALGPQGLLVVAVNYRETDAALKRFLDQTSVGLPVLRDVDGLASRAFGVRVFPTTLLVDRQGRARASMVGECDWNGSEMRHWLARYLKA